MSTPNFEQTARAIISTMPVHTRERATADVDVLRRHGASSKRDVIDIAGKNDLTSHVRSIAVWWIPLLRIRPREDAERVLESCLESPDAELRGQAARAIGRGAFRRCVPELIASLHDRESAVRRAAAYALGILGGPLAMHELLSVLADDRESAAVRGMAAEGLGNLGNSRAIKALTASLTDEQAEVRFFSAFALGQLRAQGVLSILERLAATDEAVVEGHGRVCDEARKAIRTIRSGRG